MTYNEKMLKVSNQHDDGNQTNQTLLQACKKAGVGERRQTELMRMQRQDGRDFA